MSETPADKAGPAARPYNEAGMNTKTKNTPRLLAAAALAAACTGAFALDLRPDGASLQGSWGTNSARMAGAGLHWDWDWERPWRQVTLAARTELLANYWRADDFGGGSRDWLQLVLLPTLRFEFAPERAWYAELGVGASWLSSQYRTPQRRLGTQWNFYDVVGVGRSFGAQREHEVGLRWIHVSNLGIREPNPGLDFLQLRYARRF